MKLIRQDWTYVNPFHNKLVEITKHPTEAPSALIVFIVYLWPYYTEYVQSISRYYLDTRIMCLVSFIHKIQLSYLSKPPVKICIYETVYSALLPSQKQEILCKSNLQCLGYPLQHFPSLPLLVWVEAWAMSLFIYVLFYRAEDWTPVRLWFYE